MGATSERPKVIEAVVVNDRGADLEVPGSLIDVVHREGGIYVPNAGSSPEALSEYLVWRDTWAKSTALGFADEVDAMLRSAGEPGGQAADALRISEAGGGWVQIGVLDLMRFSGAFSEAQDILEERGLAFPPVITKAIMQVVGRAIAVGEVAIGPMVYVPTTSNDGL
jgi:hypothetical protein